MPKVCRLGVVGISGLPGGYEVMSQNGQVIIWRKKKRGNYIKTARFGKLPVMREHKQSVIYKNFSNTMALSPRHISDPGPNGRAGQAACYLHLWCAVSWPDTPILPAKKLAPAGKPAETGPWPSQFGWQQKTSPLVGSQVKSGANGKLPWIRQQSLPLATAPRLRTIYTRHRGFPCNADAPVLPLQLINFLGKIYSTTSLHFQKKNRYIFMCKCSYVSLICW